MIPPTLQKLIQRGIARPEILTIDGLGVSPQGYLVYHEGKSEILHFWANAEMPEEFWVRQWNKMFDPRPAVEVLVPDTIREKIYEREYYYSY